MAAAAQARTMAPPLAAMTPANLKETFDAEGLEKLRKKVFVEHEHLHWLPLCEWEKRVPIGQPTSVGAKQAVTEAVQVAVDKYKVSIEANSFVHNSTQLLATGKHQSQTH